MEQIRDTLVIIVHGIQGSPGLYDWLEQYAAARADVQNLLLPGHGGCVGDFIRSGMAQWLSFVEEAALAARARYRRVVYVGHSMGCLLGLEAALKHPGIFDSMILLACPLRVKFTWRYFKYNFLAACPWPSSDIYVNAARKGNSVSSRTPLGYLAAAPQFVQLLREISALRRRLTPPGIPVTAFFGEIDEIVSPRAPQELRRIGADVRILPGCSHNYFPESARDSILHALQHGILSIERMDARREIKKQPAMADRKAGLIMEMQEFEIRDGVLRSYCGGSAAHEFAMRKGIEFREM